MSMEKDVSNDMLKAHISQLQSDLKCLKETHEEIRQAYINKHDENHALRERVKELEHTFGNLISELFSINSNEKADCLFFGCNCCDVTWHGVNSEGSELIKEAYRVLSKGMDV